MLERQRTQQLSRECLSETTIVPLVPADPAEISRLLSIVQERLLHPQATMQVFADTFLLNSLTRALLDQSAKFGQERITSLVYTERRLAVFELGVVAMLTCSDFNMLKKEHFYVFLEHERRIWEDRAWQLRIEQESHTCETTRFPLGFIQPQDIKQSPLLRDETSASGGNHDAS
jgi:hypothetical protein